MTKPRTISSRIRTGRARFIHLYSFSKVFCLTGYRVGALVGAPALIENVAKAMDTVAICAPRIGQLAASCAASMPWALGAVANTLLMRERLTALRSALSRNDLGYELISAGAYFAYVRHPHRGRSAADVARRLVDRQNLLALPGAMFGPGQERLSARRLCQCGEGLDAADRRASGRRRRFVIDC